MSERPREALTVSIKAGLKPWQDAVVKLSSGVDLTALGISRIEIDIRAQENPEARLTLTEFEFLDLEALRLALPMESLVSLAAAHGCDVVAKAPRG